MHLTPNSLISALLSAILLASCGGGGGSAGGGMAPNTRDPGTFQGASDIAAEELSDVARRFVEASDAGTDPNTETNIDVFGDGSLIVDLMLHVADDKLVIDTDDPDASLEFEITDLDGFFGDGWNGSLVVLSPAPAPQPANASIPQNSPIRTTGTATQKGVAAGALRVGNDSMLLAGSSEINITFGETSLDIRVLMKEFDSNGLSDNTVGIVANDVKFNSNGTLTAGHMFRVDSALTSGTADDLIYIEGDREIEGVLNEDEDRQALLGPGGQTSVFYGEIEDPNGNLIWGAISKQVPSE